MKINEFLNKYTGKKVDFDGAYGAQCVDLFRQYCKDVLEIPHTGSVNGAKDLYWKYKELPNEVKYFNRFPLSELLLGDASIKCGDVAIWDETGSNKYGHVAIVIDRLPDGLLVFEQDGFAQDGAKFSERKYTNLLGVLRKK